MVAMIAPRGWCGGRPSAWRDHPDVARNAIVDDAAGAQRERGGVDAIDLADQHPAGRRSV